jgi:arylsulfatase A-like enzyme
MILNQFFKLIFLIFISCKIQHKEVNNKNIKKPNFIFILSDDQRFDAIGYDSNYKVKTPNLDKLARNGAVFTNTYNMGAWGGAICVASRSMLITGKSVWNVKTQLQDSSKLSKTIQNSWPRVFKKNGYNTYISGKWHVQLPIDEIFDSVKTITPGMPDDNRKLFSVGLNRWKKKSGDIIKLEDYMPVGYARPKNKLDNSWKSYDSIHGGFWKGGKHWSEALAEDAISLIDDANQKEKPFFMYLAFNAPHDPRQSPKKYLDLYPLDSISMPPNYANQHPYFNQIGNMPDVRDEALVPYPRTEFAIKKHLQEYYAAITHMDAQIGKIIGHIQKNDLIENTYVIFTSDHGLAVGQHGLVGKQSLYDHSIRVPMIISGPNIEKNTRLHHDVYLQDIVPTSLDFAEIRLSNETDFKSFKGILLKKDDKQINEAIYGTYSCCAENYYDYQRMIRKDGFKLMLFPKNKRIELYDIEKDPYEINNLALNSKYKDKIASLANDFIALQKIYNDTLDVKNIFKGIWSFSAD